MKEEEINVSLSPVIDRGDLPDKEGTITTAYNNTNTHTYLNSYVVNNLSQLTKTDEKGNYITPKSTINAGGKGKYKVKYALLIEVDENVSLWAKQLTPFDTAMLSCAASIWVNGGDIIDPDMLYKEWANGNRLKKSGLTREMISDSILKLSSIRLDYDYTQELKRKYPTFTGKATVEGHIIELSPVRIKKGGHEKTVYRMLCEPPILTHARSVEQIITVNKEVWFTIYDVLHKKEWDDQKGEYIDIKRLLTSEISVSSERLLVRDYLIKRIQEYKSYIARFTTITSGKRKAGEDKKKPQPKPFNKILLDTMFKELEITDKDKKTRLKTFLIQCLDNYELKGEIKEYTTESSNGIKSITFFV